MSRANIHAALALAALLATLPARAAPVRLDDSLSSQTRVQLRQEWRNTFPVRGRRPDLLGILARASIEVRLKTSAYVGRTARIFLVLPTLSNAGALPPDLLVEWRTRGTMRAGIGAPGSRTLVFEGRIASAITGDWFDFYVTADSRTVGNNVQFEPYFDIETQ